MWLSERIEARAISVVQLVHWYTVEQHIVHIQGYALFVPEHAPGMKFTGPGGAPQIGNSFALAKPVCFPALVCACGNIGQDVALIIFHNVNFAVRWPLFIHSEGPESRPESTAHRYPRPHLKQAKLPAMLA